MSEINKVDDEINALFARVNNLISNARLHVERSVNHEMVKTYFLIGKEIVEEEQKGKERAEYGKQILQKLSRRLQNEYKKGFGVDTLEQARKFYLVYQIDIGMNQISDTLSRKSSIPKLNQNLSWSHYRELIKVKITDARQFYEIEAAENNWSVRELERQISSLLFERFALSKDKDRVKELSARGHEMKLNQHQMQ